MGFTEKELELLLSCVNLELEFRQKGDPDYELILFLRAKLKSMNERHSIKR